jgi:hypothetical protein
MRSPSTEPPEAIDTEASLDLMVQALLAREGFLAVGRIAAELTGARVEVLVPRPGSEGFDGSPAERYVATLVAGRLPAWPVDVTDVVPIAVEGVVKGAVVASGPIAPGTEGHLRSAARAALTGIAILETREETGLTHASGLVADLLEGHPVEAEEVAARAGRLGCDLRGGFHALAVEVPLVRGPGEIAATIVELHPGALTEPFGRAVFALLPGGRVESVGLAASLGEDIARAHSSRYADPAEAGRALDETRALFALAASSAVRNTDRVTWDSLRIIHGAYVGDPARLRDFSERTVGELIRCDDAEDGRLQHTFWTYQEANCNMNVAAESLATHRHTVANRLRRIRELTGLDPQRGYDRELLGLALRAHLVIGSSHWPAARRPS